MRSKTSRVIVILTTLALLASSCGSSADVSDQAVPPSTSSVASPTSVPLVSNDSPADGSTPVSDGTIQLIAQVNDRELSPEANGAAVNSVIAGTNQFAVELFKTVADPAENAVVGNHSLSTVLLLAMAGTNGETTSAFAELLGIGDVRPDELHRAVNAIDLILESRTNDGVELSTANALFVQEGLELTDDFLNTAVGSYGAPVRAVDFVVDSDAAADAVNSWVSNQTDGFVEKLTDGYSPQTIVVLANAMYLKASWAVQFRRLGTLGPFTRSDGTTVQTELMAHDDFLPLSTGPDFIAIELPYQGGNLGLVVVQPVDLAAFEAGLTAERLGEIAGGLRESGIHLTMPIWSTKTSMEALEPLHRLGLPKTYDFSNLFIGGDAGYFIDSVSHVARIDVDETGTTAAAASDVVINGSHGPTIEIDRPFFYFIRDRGSNTILFMGHVTDPTKTD